MTTIVIVSSCTGMKSVSWPDAITHEDFQQGETHRQARERRLGTLLSKHLYTGRQHRLLVDGIRTLRAARSDVQILPYVVSAGYGLLREDQPIAPYDLTFQTMSSSEALSWGEQLRLPADLEHLLRSTFDLALVLLGARYLDACALDRVSHPGGPVLIAGGSDAAQLCGRNPALAHLLIRPDHCQAFGAPQTALKGAIARHLLDRISHEGPDVIDALLADPAHWLDRTAPPRESDQASPAPQYAMDLDPRTADSHTTPTRPA